MEPPASALDAIRMPPTWPDRVDRDWAWGASTGKGAVVAVVDSGIERGHPLVGEVEEAVVVTGALGEEPSIDEDEQGDACGHGTACAGIIRALAPECRLVSVRVLGSGWKGSGRLLVAGLRWAIERGVDVINMSLSDDRPRAALHELTDDGLLQPDDRRRIRPQHAGRELPLALLLGALGRQPRARRPADVLLQPRPAGRVLRPRRRRRGGLARRLDVRSTGNSFATPHMAGLCALIRAKHPELTPFQVKSVLYLTANNVRRHVHG